MTISLDDTRPVSADARSPRTILGLPLETIAADDAVRQIVAWAKASRGAYVCVPNVYMLMLARDDAAFRNVFVDADLRVTDSMVVQRAMAFLHGGDIPETLLGSRLTQRLCAQAARQKVRVGFFGGMPTTITTLVETLRAETPDLEVVYAVAPPFGPVDPERVAAAAREIAAADVQLLFVGLGCPKQENWMATAHPHLPRTTMIGVGAAFDTLAGVVPAAPAWVHQNGLEWAYRLTREPKRLWKRYISTSPQFLAAILREKLFGARA